MEKIKAYIDKNKERFLNELFDMLKIPSVSADPAQKDNMHKMAAYVREKLEEAGADKAELCETAGYPIVYAEKIINPKLPTVLVRSEEHTSELQSLMRISYAVFCLKK